MTLLVDARPQEKAPAHGNSLAHPRRGVHQHRGRGRLEENMTSSYWQRFKTSEQRFWEKVCVTPGCWLWTAGINSNGYGKIKIGTQNIGAHRFSYELHNGAIPAELFVCHKCDLKMCVNPDHLFLGTAADNTHDMFQKGRDRGSRTAACRFGHQYTDENTYTDKKGCRSCRTCRRMSNQKRRSF